MAAAALIVGLLLGRALAPPDGDDAAGPGRARPPATPSAHALPRGFVEFRDERAGFSITHPASWRRLEPRDSDVKLLAGRGTEASLLVRAAPAGRAPRPGVKQLTARILRSGNGVRLIARPQRVRLGGVPGYAYLYTFTDAAGARGAHLQYFLFHRHTLITVVLQAMPARRLPHLAPVFRKIAQSFLPRG